METRAPLQLADLPAYALQLLNDTVVKLGFTEYSMKPSHGAEIGDGFQGDVVRVQVDGVRKVEDELNNAASMKLILKIAPENANRRRVCETTISFDKEKTVYDKIYPNMIDFLVQKGITRSDGFFDYVESYGTCGDKDNGDYAIVMEDLRARGYDMWSKTSPINLAHAEMVMQQLGRFHAISFAIRDQDDKLFAQLKQFDSSTIRNTLLSDTAKYYNDLYYDRAISTLDPNEEALRSQMSALKLTHWTKMAKCTVETALSRYSVINHGDCKVNNIMFQYPEDSSIPKMVCFYDWQLAQFCTPAMDLSHFLFSAVEKDLRDSHYDHLIEAYYISLDAAITKLGSKTTELITLAELKDQMYKYAIYGILTAPTSLQYVMADPTKPVDLNAISDKIAETGQMVFDGYVPSDNDAYRKRMSDVIRDFFNKYKL